MERVRFADGVSQQIAGWAVASGHVQERWVAELLFSTRAQRPPDLVFADLTGWSIVQPSGWPDYRYNDRAVILAFADHGAPTYTWLVANGVKFKKATKHV